MIRNQEKGQSLLMSPSSLENRHILLAVSGGIAAYKAADIIRRLKREDAAVTVVMTEASTRFISALTLQTLSERQLFVDPFSAPLSHIEIPKSADLMLVAPATANIIGKMASGIADDMVSLSFLSFTGPVVIAPAMNSKMYEHPVVQRNLGWLKDSGVYEVGPEAGELACGDTGRGRLAPVERIVEAVKYMFSRKDLAGLRILVTAGPTREYIDPVRFISNRSSGRMGFALARIAMRRGAEVTLISGPTALSPPEGVRYTGVETGGEFLEAVQRSVEGGTDILVMAAAVADFAPEGFSKKKIGKESIKDIKLKKTPDIVKFVSGMENRPFIIGFSAETGPDIAKTKNKLRDKGMDFAVFNDVTQEGAGFDTDTNMISIVDYNGVYSFPLMSKEECAGVIFDHYLKRGK